MRLRPFFLLAVLAAAPAGAPAAERPITFNADSGESVAAFQGSFDVPENRSDPDSRTIALSYVRFPATGAEAGPPIIYLAGGPGGSGSGTARGRRFPLFMAMRQHGDVIAFDQRGTGDSTRLPRCTSSVDVPEDRAIDDATYAGLWRRAARECGAWWAAQGIDLAGYDTLESVADLDALREELGAERISLWGISYGSHLAFAALDAIPERIERVVIASAEGLDQTVKLPARTDAYFARLQQAIDAQPAAAARYPDVAGLMRRVHARLEAEPAMLQLATGDATTRPFLLQRWRLQQMAGSLIADPETAAALLALYAALDQGDTRLATAIAGFLDEPGPITLAAMPTAMDVASGITPARLAEVRRQAETALLRDYLNFPMPQLAGVWNGVDLGDDFRAGPNGDTPVLLLTGTLDGRTYPEGQREAVAGLSRVTQVIVRNAGHNLFMSSPEVAEAICRFMRGEDVGAREIVVDAPDLTQLPDMPD